MGKGISLVVRQSYNMTSFRLQEKEKCYQDKLLMQHIQKIQHFTKVYVNDSLPTPLKSSATIFIAWTKDNASLAITLGLSVAIAIVVDFATLSHTPCPESVVTFYQITFVNFFYESGCTRVSVY
jgi:hypothetical protein